MKISYFTKITLSLLTVAVGISAQAKPTSSDFNSLIEENMATQRQLRNELDKDLKTEKLNQHQQPDFVKVGEEVLGRGTSENVVVAIDARDPKPSKWDKTKANVEKKNFKRLSQEIREIK